MANTSKTLQGINIIKLTMNKSVYFVSLGCSKNLVDSEIMLGLLKENKYEIINNPSEASIIVINTCSFIESAKSESIDAILEFTDYKKPDTGKCKLLVVTGCLSQRYAKEIENELCEVDLIIGTGEFHRILDFIDNKLTNKKSLKTYVDKPTFIYDETYPRLLTTPNYTAWIKISEGCNRNCTFCVIPLIRGKLRSRTVESIINEVKSLTDTGVKEVNIISQDLSQYGIDLNNSNNLLNLLDQLDKINDLKWIRLFYYYPDELDYNVIKKISSSDKICHYLDIPIQHFSNSILKKNESQYFQ